MLGRVWAWARGLKWLLTVIITAFACHSANSQTFQDEVDAAIALFSDGDYAATYWKLEAIELEFGEEPEFTDREFQRTILPVRAYSALAANRPTDALVYFTELLLHHEPRAGLRAFILYNAAIAQSQTDALAAAAKTFRTFQESFPGTQEAALAFLQEADLTYEIGEYDKASALLDQFFASDASETLRMQARLRALQISAESSDFERTKNLLFNTDWNVAAMPDIAVLSFAALDAGDLLLAEGDYISAIRAYRLTLPHPILIEKQRERLDAARETLRYSPYASSIWQSHSTQLIQRLESQLARLETMEDYTPGLYLRSGQAYLLASRFREATILFREIAQNESFEQSIRAEAHYRWIIALTEADKWKDARDCAELFLEQHPDHILANRALFLIARTYQGEGDYRAAIEVLDQLIESFPTDPQAARWFFSRGYNYSVLEEYNAARENFTGGLSNYPTSPLAPQLELWNALTYFFEREYPRSLELLSALAEKSASLPIYPETLYRIANTHYASRDYEATLETTQKLIRNFQDHHRVSEALALRGDTYMGLGELILAIDAFKKVPDDDPKLYDYSVFQISKIYKALEEYDLLRKHLQTYTDREDAAERPRVSEALYWIGWSLQQEDRAEEAFPIYESALARFGNDPKARSVESILAAFADLYRRSESTAAPDRPSLDRWLQEQAKKSLMDEELTRYARFTRFIAQRQRRQIDDATADGTLLSIHRLVPLEQQDPSTLAEIGLILANRGYESADDYFEYILNEYPERNQRSAAYYGKAQLAAQKDRLAKSRRWLIRFLEETPTAPQAAGARLLSAEILRKQGLYDAARAALTEVLSLKELRGRPHAQALAELARIETELENPKRAIPYWQRIYTLYRGYSDLIGEAYWESALLFEAIEDPVAARNTLQEMLRDERLKSQPVYALALEALPRLEEKASALSELSNHSEPLTAQP